MKRIVLFTIAALFLTFTKAQNANDVLELLIEKGSISQAEADTLRADAALKEQEDASKKKSFNLTSGKAIQLAGYTHVRYQYLEESGKNDGVDIRRAYLDVKGKLSPYWTYRLQTDFANTPKIVDAQVDLLLKDYLNFTFGQQVIPFTLNSTTSNTKLELADRVQAVETFSSRKGDVLGDNNGRDIGISLYGKLFEINKLPLIDYRIGVYNGSGINRTELNEAKDIIGRIILHPLKGLDLGGSFYSGWTPDSLSLANAKLSNTPTNQLGLRQRIGGELSYTYMFLNFQAEYLTGNDGEIKKSGYYTQLAAFILPGKVQLVGRYDSFDKNIESNGDLRSNLTFGLNVFFSPNALLQIAYTVRIEETNEVVNNLGTVQLQASF